MEPTSLAIFNSSFDIFLATREMEKLTLQSPFQGGF